MYAGPDRCRLAFFLYIVAAISDEGPGMAIGHHVGPEVAAIGAAKLSIDPDARYQRAGDMAFADEGAQVFGGCFPGGLSIGARLTRLGRVGSP